MRASRVEALFAAALLGVAGLAAAEPQFAIQFVADGNTPAVEVSGVSAQQLEALARAEFTPAQWAALLSVYAEPTGPAPGAALPPVAGAWSVDGKTLRFAPQFPFARGASYRAVFQPARLPGGDMSAKEVTATFSLPNDTAAPTTVVADVFPRAGVLPENQLKFYVQFSAPMSRGGIYDFVSIRDAQGRAADLPFLDLHEELWNPEMTRVTLFIDPGRIKRGVQPLEELGPVFEEGKTYTLEISAQWRDASGRPLREPFRKQFRIGPADRTPPDPARWTLRPPAAGGRGALVVVFDEPLDHALALRMIEPRTPDGKAIPGTAGLDDDDRRWTFIPDAPWAAGDYQLVIQTIIEDLAGNNIGKPFDVDVFSGVQRSLAAPTVAVPFSVK